MTDQPSAALVMDLNSAACWIPPSCFGLANSDGYLFRRGRWRDHNRQGFSLWMAGGGFKKGYVHGGTDEFGGKSMQDPIGSIDLHATLLHTLGLNLSAAYLSA